MKKYVLLFMLVCLATSFIACGQDEVSEVENDNQDVILGDEQASNSFDDKDEDVSIKKENDIETETICVGEKYFDYPATHTSEDLFTNDFFMLEDEIILGISYDSGEEFNDSLEKVIDYVNKGKFTEAASRLAGGGPAANLGEDIVAKTSEKVTVNGIDCMKFTGSTLNKSTNADLNSEELYDAEWDAYVYGYAFLVNNVSYAVIGIVTPEEQEQSMIDEMKQQVDDIMASIRDER